MLDAQSISAFYWPINILLQLIMALLHHIVLETLWMLETGMTHNDGLLASILSREDTQLICKGKELPYVFVPENISLSQNQLHIFDTELLKN